MPKPSGRRIDYPVCGDWSCEDYDYDWEPIGPDDPAYSDVKREYEIVYYHQPRTDWLRRLQAERDKRNGGEPLWSGAGSSSSPSVAPTDSLPDAKGQAKP